MRKRPSYTRCGHLVGPTYWSSSSSSSAATELYDASVILSVATWTGAVDYDYYTSLLIAVFMYCCMHVQQYSSRHAKEALVHEVYPPGRPYSSNSSATSTLYAHLYTSTNTAVCDSSTDPLVLRAYQQSVSMPTPTYVQGQSIILLPTSSPTRLCASLLHPPLPSLSALPPSPSLSPYVPSPLSPPYAPTTPSAWPFISRRSPQAQPHPFLLRIRVPPRPSRPLTALSRPRPQQVGKWPFPKQPSVRYRQPRRVPRRCTLRRRP